jgi:hypothetical protein
MLLQVAEPPECNVRVITADPDPNLIASTVFGLAWSDITFVELWVDDEHSMCGSGSLRHGLAGSYWEGDRQYVSERPLDSLEEMVELLQSYRAGDNKWREMIGWE